eukprot:TRINITY_DN14652_c0_g1_i2.p1 TRINITY_DN14652_c0_g1~~TRINITY_DN14652_c0_g1_i2.p1  ORF type:complete len:102 (-),score=16.85 TRINITY_DN14652_c0_g1_i2:180-485(-)
MDLLHNLGELWMSIPALQIHEFLPRVDIHHPQLFDKFFRFFSDLNFSFLGNILLKSVVEIPKIDLKEYQKLILTISSSLHQLHSCSKLPRIPEDNTASSVS